MEVLSLRFRSSEAGRNKDTAGLHTSVLVNTFELGQGTRVKDML